MLRLLVQLFGTDSNGVDDIAGHGNSDVESVEASMCF